MTAGVARPFSELFGGRAGDGSLASLARHAARAGYAVMPIKPGEKKPLCALTPRQAKAADKEAAEAARDAGRRNWERVRHDCGSAHATTDPDVAHKVFKRLEAEHEGLNMAVEITGSRVLVVDADTVDELTSFTTLWAEEEAEPDLEWAAPTVRSPGVVDEDGNWKHSDGGHYWFLLPDDVDLGSLAGVTAIPIGNDPDAQAQLKVAGYVLVPPSVRDEGEYLMCSDAHIAPEWLIERTQLYLTERRTVREHRRDAALDADDRITLSQSAMTWASILGPRGWSLWFKVDRCGCEIWTAPGDHGSPKSATAHDAGCGQFDTTDGFLHLWTDNPPGEMSAAGTKTFSKIQVVAWLDHGGDMSTAMEDLGIETGSARADQEWMESLGLAGSAGTGSERAQSVSSDQEYLDRLMDRQRTTGDDRGGPEGEEADTDEEEFDDEDDEEDRDPVEELLAELIPAGRLDSIPPPVPLVGGLLDMDSLARVVGKSGHGKSFFMIDLAGHIATGHRWQGRDVRQGKVAYMVAEGAAGIRKRVRAWELHHGVDMGDNVLFLPRPVQVKATEWLVWIAAMARIKPSLIVIDTQARVTAGANENGPEDMGLMVQRMEMLRAQTGACVVLVHHKGHSGDHGRGHSSVVAAMDAEIEVAKEGSGRVAILSTKQKDQEDFQPIRLNMESVTVGDGDEQTTSVVLVAPEESGPAGVDPFTDETPRVDESSVTHERLAKWVFLGFQDGAGGTKGEIGSYVRERDRNRLGKPMSRSSFLEAWGKLEKAAVLVDQGGKRFKLSQSEILRLGLGST